MDHFVQCVLIAQVGTQTDAVRQTEFLEQFGFAQVESKKQGLLSVQGVNGGDVDAVEGLSYALHVAGDQDGAFFLALGNEVDVGSD